MDENCAHLLRLIKSQCEYIQDVALRLCVDLDAEAAKQDTGSCVYGPAEESKLFAIYSKLRDLADDLDAFLSPDGEDDA